MRWGWVLLTICLFILASAAGQKSARQVDLERIAKSDPRIEYLARAICKVRGIDPDFQGFPYPPGPVWEIYILQSRDLLAAIDAATEWARRHPELPPSRSKPIVPMGTNH